jgi:hypothetical protein
MDDCNTGIDLADIYVLAINGIRHDWVFNPTDILNRINELAERRGHRIIPVQDLPTFRNLVYDPPRNATFINSHGEALPLPVEEEGNWLSFIRRIGQNVRDAGWVWTSITGYPFFYYDPATSRIPQPQMLGLATFLSTAPTEIAIVPLVDENFHLTQDGTTALEKFRVQIQTPMRIGRAFFWRNVAPLVFLTSGTSHGACAIPLGTGYFVHCGVSSSDLGYQSPDCVSDRQIADFAIAFTLAVCESDLELAFNAHKDNEDEFRENVVRPMLQRVGFRGVHTLHPREFGKDLVFYDLDRFGEKKYYAAQISVKRINKNVRGNTDGYAGIISRQVNEAFSCPFTEPDTGEEYWIHETYVFTSKGITADASELVRNRAGEKKGLIHLFDGSRIREMLRTT